MNYGSQGDEKTRVRAAVSESDVKRRSSAMKENDEWVTAANARVRETQQGTRTPNKIQERQVKERRGEKEAKRNLLAEFSTPDGYARGKSKPIGAINEEDTVIMTSALKKVSSADVAKRTAEVQKKPIPTPRVQMQNRTVSQPERRIPSASRQIPPRQNTPERYMSIVFKT